MIPILIYRFGAVFEEVIKSLDDWHTLLKAEVEHADCEEHAVDKWLKEMDHLQGLLRFEGSECGEKHKESQNKVFSSSGSGSWFLGQYEYKEWRDSWSDEPGQLFWLYGLHKLQHTGFFFCLLTVSSGVRKDGFNVSDIGQYVLSCSSNIFPDPL